VRWELWVSDIVTFNTFAETYIVKPICFVYDGIKRKVEKLYTKTVVWKMSFMFVCMLSVDIVLNMLTEQVFYCLVQNLHYFFAFFLILETATTIAATF